MFFDHGAGVVGPEPGVDHLATDIVALEQQIAVDLPRGGVVRVIWRSRTAASIPPSILPRAWG
jgi:hypothetical protein